MVLTEKSFLVFIKSRDSVFILNTVMQRDLNPERFYNALKPRQNTTIYIPVDILPIKLSRFHLGFVLSTNCS